MHPVRLWPQDDPTLGLQTFQGPQLTGYSLVWDLDLIETFDFHDIIWHKKDHTTSLDLSSRSKILEISQLNLQRPSHDA